MCLTKKKDIICINNGNVDNSEQKRKMNSYSANNKRIVKNTLYMYIRMLLLIGVSLYTSRVILRVLGTEDFGTYSVVGGVVIMFAFISSAMATGTQRHMSYELGKAGGNVPLIFTACFKIHVVLSFIVFILAETLGLWFLNAKMNFPSERMDIVNWIYQFSILTCIIGIIQVPYTAAIVAHEKLSFYAYVGILDALMKLGIVFLLTVIHIDKLFLYGLLLVVVQLITFLINASFCHHKLPQIKFIAVQDSALYRKLLSFSGWSIFGSLANAGYQQGVNIIINIFYGVTLNTAVGIANQVNSAVTQFVTGFQQALNPQLIQAEASKDMKRQIDLIQKSSRFSYLIMLCIVYPLLCNIDCVLRIWLGSYPDYTNSICMLIVLGALIETLSGPLWVTIYATGRIKVYQIVISIILLFNLPLSFLWGKMGLPPYGVYFIRIALFVIALATRIIFVVSYIGMDWHIFFKNVILPTGFVSIVLFGLYFLAHYYNFVAVSFGQLFYQTIIHLLVVLVLSFFIGLTCEERIKILSKLTSRKKRYGNNLSI